MSTNRDHVNTAEIVGRLGQDPDLKRTEDGTPYVKLSIATTERFTDKDHKIREKTEWHHATAWGPKAEELAAEFKKGESIALSGSLRINSYESIRRARTSTTRLPRTRPAWWASCARSRRRARWARAGR
jgi:single-strand DNA-binding protein